jgi:hypothetical protein
MLFSRPLIESLRLEATFGLPSKGPTFNSRSRKREPCLRYAFWKKIRGAFAAPRIRRRIFCSELRSRSAERIRCTSLLSRVAIFAHPHETHGPRFCSLLVARPAPVSASASARRDGYLFQPFESFVESLEQPLIFAERAAVIDGATRD